MNDSHIAHRQRFAVQKVLIDKKFRRSKHFKKRQKCKFGKKEFHVVLFNNVSVIPGSASNFYHELEFPLTFLKVGKVET